MNALRDWLVGITADVYPVAPALGHVHTLDHDILRIHDLNAHPPLTASSEVGAALADDSASPYAHILRGRDSNDRIVLGIHRFGQESSVGFELERRVRLRSN